MESDEDNQPSTSKASLKKKRYSEEESTEEALPTEAEASSNVEESGFQNDDETLANVMTAEEYLQRKDVIMLEYEKQMFLDIVGSDGLTVCAK